MYLRSVSGALTALAVMLVGCDVSSVVDDINDQAIQASFDTVKTTAEQNGGAALLVKPGAEATLTVTNADSPINGATVVVPSGAIPSDVENAVIAIQGGGIVTDSFEYPLVVGPNALVILRKLPGLEDITPAVPLTLSLPYYADATTFPVSELVLGAIDPMAGGSPITFVDGSQAVEAKKQVSGGVSDLKFPFAGVWPVTFDGGAAAENTLIYSVTKADGTVCAGFKAAPEDLSPSLHLAGVEQLELSVAIGNGGSLTVGAMLTTPLPVPVAETTIALDGATTSFTCNGEVFSADGAAVTKLEAVFSGWNETQAVPSAQTCDSWGSTYCYTHHGQVTMAVELDYTTAAGDHVLASANKRSAGMNWTNTTDNP